MTATFVCSLFKVDDGEIEEKNSEYGLHIYPAPGLGIYYKLK